MRTMTAVDRMDMEATILYHLSLTMDSDAAIKVVSATKDGRAFMDDVMDDITTSSEWEDTGHYNDDDVRLAIGRVMMDRLGVEL